MPPRSVTSPVYTFPDAIASLHGLHLPSVFLDNYEYESKRIFCLFYFYIFCYPANIPVKKPEQIGIINHICSGFIFLNFLVLLRYARRPPGSFE